MNDKEFMRILQRVQNKHPELEYLSPEKLRELGEHDAADHLRSFIFIMEGLPNAIKEGLASTPRRKTKRTLTKHHKNLSLN